MPTISDQLWTQLEQHAAQRGVAVEVLLERWLALDSEHPLEFYYQTVQNSPASILVTDARQPDNPVIYANPASETMTGYSAAEFVGRNCRFLQNDDTDQPGLDELRRIMEQKRAGVTLLRNYRKDGTPFWNELHLAPMFDAQGEVTHFIGVQHDATARRVAEEQLWARNLELPFLFEKSIIPILIMDDMGIYIDANEAACQLLNLTKEQIIGKTGEAFVPAERRGFFSSNWQSFLQEGFREGEYELHLMDGIRRMIAFKIFAHYRPGRHALFMQDITEQKQNTERLRHSEARFRAAIEGSLDVIYLLESVFDEGGELVDFMIADLNSNAEKDIGMGREQVMGAKMRIILASPYTETLFTQYKEVVETQRVLSEEFFVPSGLPGEGWYRHEVIPIQNGVTVTKRKITEAKQAEFALRESERHFREVLENIDLIGLMLDQEGKITFCNEYLLRLTGWQREEVSDKNWFEYLISAEQANQTRFQAMIAQGTIPNYVEASILTRTGEERFIGWHNTVMHNMDGSVAGITSLGQDLTQQRQARIALEQVNQALEQRVQERTADLLQINQQLQVSEARYRTIVEDQAEMVCRYDPQTFNISFTNQAHSRFHGISPHDLIGKNLFDIFPQEEQARFRRYIAQVMAERRRGTYETSAYNAAGELRWLRWTDSVIYDAQGQPLEMQGVAVDITELKQVQQALQYERDRFQALMEISPIAITVVSPQGQISFANQQAQQLFGLTRNKIETHTYDSPVWRTTDLDGNLFPPEKQPFHRILETRQPVHDAQHAIEATDGRRILLAINGAPLLDEAGAVKEIVFLVQDITLRKQWELNLQEALEKEKQLSDLKSRFLSIVSHEFRTPLSVILTSTEILRIQGDKLNAAQRAARLERITEQVTRLTTMLNDVTAAYKGQLIQRTPQMVRFDLAMFVTRCLDEVQTALHTNREVQLTLPAECDEVMGDEDLLQHIIMNLVSNALKYSAPDAPVELHFACDAAQLVITVRDKGMGIAPKDQAQLFNLFFRGSNVGRISGTGLGLPILKQAVDTYRGTIQFESQLGVGTTFVVKLPQSVV